MSEFFIAKNKYPHSITFAFQDYCFYALQAVAFSHEKQEMKECYYYHAIKSFHVFSGFEVYEDGRTGDVPAYIKHWIYSIFGFINGENQSPVYECVIYNNIMSETGKPIFNAFIQKTKSLGLDGVLTNTGKINFHSSGIDTYFMRKFHHLNAEALLEKSVFDYQQLKAIDPEVANRYETPNYNMGEYKKEDLEPISIGLYSRQ